MLNVSEKVNLSYAHNRGITGSGVNVAVIDSGIFPHRDFERHRLVEFVDMIEGQKHFYDDNGHGTHVAGIIGSNGRYFKGIAPQVGLIGIKVLNHKGDGSLHNMINGLLWIKDNYKRYDIRIVNISVGSPPGKMYSEQSKLIRAVNSLWEEGLIVVAAAGNNGPSYNSIGAPGISRKIITVGAIPDNRSGRLSGRGPTDNCIKKPDIVAPGSRIFSCAPGVRMSYTYKSGTSMATPIVTGAIALLVSKRPNITNKEVKMKLRTTAVDLGFSHSLQGWGRIDVRRLLEG